MAKLFFFLLIPALFLAGCSQDDDKNPSKPSKVAVNSTQSPNSLQIVDDSGAPIASAQILIGTAQNAPFAGNYLTTDNNGEIQIPTAWKDAEAVTIGADGYVMLTEFARLPQMASFTLHKVNSVPTIELTGTVTNLPIVNNDGIVDFGLVMNGLTRNDLLGFDVSKIISTQVDTVTVDGETANVPSNISLPKQTETYMIFPVTINKPEYRLYFSDLGSQHVYALRGRVSFSLLTSGISGQPVYSLVNQLTLSGGSVQTINLLDSDNTANFDMMDLSYTKTLPFTAPSVPSTQVVLGIAAADLGGYMVPTDIKQINAKGTTKLAIHPTATPLAIGILKNTSEFSGTGIDRVSAVILPFGTGVNPQFLGLIASPTFDGGVNLQFTKPADMTGVNELATYSVLSEVRDVTVGSSTMPILIHEWEVYAPAWVNQMTLPIWPGVPPQAAKKRWEVSYLGSQLSKQADLGQAVIDAATHITHSSVDF